MSLSRKTLLYSTVLALLMVVFVVGYFAVMLPSLYVDYVERSNLASVIEIQKGYTQNRTYDGLSVRNPTAVYSFELPDEGDELFVTGKFFTLKATVRDEELRSLLERLRGLLRGVSSGEISADAEYFREDMLEEGGALWAQIKEKLTGEDWIPETYPVAVQVETKTGGDAFGQAYWKLHQMEDMLVYEAGISDEEYGYTTYIAAGRGESAYIFTVLPAMTPRMDELMPVVAESLPMIIAVVFFMVLLCSRFFSGKIVNPVIRLAGYAQTVGLADSFEEDAFCLDTDDEIGALGRSLQELYQKLHDSYAQLEEKNRLLEEENERKEVFLRASSHQLKTPIAAALLLVEGMINEVGKYKDAKAYLPEVKKQLLSMRKLVEDILHLDDHAAHEEREAVAVETLGEELVRAYAVQIEAKGLRVSVTGSGVFTADREMLRTVTDNLLSNAVQYTPDGEQIEITAGKDSLRIRNYGVTIDEKLLPNIYEPFVSSDSRTKGKGLGLYVAAYYGRLMGCRLNVQNMGNSVCAEFERQDGDICRQAAAAGAADSGKVW